MCFALLLLHKCETLLVVHTMPNIILKTFAPSHNKLMFSFHGNSLTDAMITKINERLDIICPKIWRDRFFFKWNSFNGNYEFAITEDRAKNLEINILCVILDCMEEMCYIFRFQYEQEHASMNPSYSDAKEKLFLFSHKSESV